MFALIRKWLGSTFTDEQLGLLMCKLLVAAGKPIVKDFFNTENQKKALEYVKELSKRNDLNSMEKAEMFNIKFLNFLKLGANQVSKSVLNCLREMAVVALKSETETESK